MTSEPSLLHRTLSNGDEQIWFIQFSNNGKYMASGGTGKSIIVWDVDRIINGETDERRVQRNRYQCRGQLLSPPMWSPDDSCLLTAFPKAFCLWNTLTGEVLRSIDAHPFLMRSCAWAPNGLSFFSGEMIGEILEWTAETGDNALVYRNEYSVLDLAVSTIESGERLVAIDSNRTITIIDLQSHNVLHTIAQPMLLVSCSLARNSVSLLVTVTPDHDATNCAVHEWNIETGLQSKIFNGSSQRNFVIRGCFGGEQHEFVLCGSEDSKIHLWDRESERLVMRHKGHSGTVNAVACSPLDAHIFASASDDGSVIVSINCTS